VDARRAVRVLDRRDVEAGHLDAAREQVAHQVDPEKAGPAGDQHPHGGGRRSATATAGAAASQAATAWATVWSAVPSTGCDAGSPRPTPHSTGSPEPAPSCTTASATHSDVGSAAVTWATRRSGRRASTTSRM